MLMNRVDCISYLKFHRLTTMVKMCNQNEFQGAALNSDVLFCVVFQSR